MEGDTRSARSGKSDQVLEPEFRLPRLPHLCQRDDISCAHQNDPDAHGGVRNEWLDAFERWDRIFIGDQRARLYAHLTRRAA